MIKHIEKYLKNNANGLQRVQNKHGKKFICNGYDAFIFNESIPGIETLPQQEEVYSINLDNFMQPKAEFRDITTDEYLILKNISKYKKFCSTKNIDTQYMSIFGDYFDVEYIKNIVNIMRKIRRLKISKENELRTPVYCSIGSIDSITMPIRASEDDSKILDRLIIEFLKEIKND